MSLVTLRRLYRNYTADVVDIVTVIRLKMLPQLPPLLQGTYLPSFSVMAYPCPSSLQSAYVQ
jgi:hypothetical protein